MSELSEAIAAPRADVLPGYILSAPRLPEIGIAEDRFAQWHMRRAIKATATAPAAIQTSLIGEASKDVRDGWFTYGMPGFDAMAKSARASSLLLWLCVRIKHPQMTLVECRLLTASDSAVEARVAEAVLELFGYLKGAASKKKKVRRKKNPAPSPGGESSEPSATPSPSADAA